VSFSPYSIIMSSLWHSLPPHHAFRHSQKFATTAHPLIGRIMTCPRRRPRSSPPPPINTVHLTCTCTCHHAPHTLASSEWVGKSIRMNHRQRIYSIQRGDMRDICWKSLFPNERPIVRFHVSSLFVVTSTVRHLRF